MSDDMTTYQKLTARCEPADHRTKPAGGRELTYVDGETIVSRLNDVLGYDGWSFEVGQINVLEREVWATGRLTVYTGERTIVREQAGGQIINRTRAGEIVELGNDIKGAVTDCLKKCATLVGVGLYLYDPNERREVEAEMQAAKRAPKPAKLTPDEKVHAAAQVTGAPPTTMKTKLELVADLQKGMAYARSIGLEPAEHDTSKFTRADFEEVIDALREQCRYVLAERKKQAASAS